MNTLVFREICQSMTIYSDAENWSRNLPFITTDELKTKPADQLISVMVECLDRMLEEEKKSGRDLYSFVSSLIANKKRQLMTGPISAGALKEALDEMNGIHKKYTSDTLEGDQYFSLALPDRAVKLASLHVVSAFIKLKPSQKRPDTFAGQAASFFQEMAIWAGETTEFKFPFRPRHFSKIDLSQAGENQMKAVNASLKEIQWQKNKLVGL